MRCKTQTKTAASDLDQNKDNFIGPFTEGYALALEWWEEEKRFERRYKTWLKAMEEKQRGTANEEDNKAMVWAEKAIKAMVFDEKVSVFVMEPSPRLTLDSLQTRT